MENWNAKIQSWFLKAKDTWIFYAIFFVLSISLPLLLPPLLKNVKISNFLNLLNYKLPIWSLLLSILLTWIFYKIYKKIINKGTLEVLKATYGLDSRIIDITKQLKGYIGSNKLKVVLSNNIGGDPVPGIVKKGLIEYKVGNKYITREYIENDVIDLP